MQTGTIEKLEEFGFQTKEPCLTILPNGTATGPKCDNPDEHVFFDGIHPSSAGHKIVFESLKELLLENDLLEEKPMPPSTGSYSPQSPSPNADTYYPPSPSPSREPEQYYPPSPSPARPEYYPPPPSGRRARRLLSA
jgi:hypothetical protein